MMPDNAPPPLGKNTERYLVRTAANMAEAITFLIGIAMQSGMQSVACKLNGVRKELRSISAQPDGSGTKESASPDHHDSDRANRPN